MAKSSRFFVAVVVLLVTKIASAQDDGDVRLVGGRTNSEGNVEVFFNFTWRPVCDDSWDIRDGTVVCNSLGFPGADTASPDFGPVDRNLFLLDEVDCVGNETNILECPHSGVGNHDCFSFEAAGVICNPTVRLVGDGSNNMMGNVEVYIDGEWGYVCDDDWDLLEATVVCNQLGYTGVAQALSFAPFGFGNGTLHLDNLACFGNEASLQDCNASDIHDCGPFEAAGVICSYPDGHGDVRLVGGNLPREGNVDILIDGIWGFICDDSWGVEEAMVVCRQLGYPGIVLATSRAEFGNGMGNVFLDELDCIGNENTLLDCGHGGIGIHDCFSSEAAGVVCERPIRLVGGAALGEGNVEVYAGGVWGYVCDDGWGQEEADVACRELGFSGISQAVVTAHFGFGNGTLLLDELGCYGNESSLLDCRHSGIGVHDCFSFEAAGVICSTDDYVEDGTLRLAGGSFEHEGNVDIYFNGEWGFICDDEWGIEEANVVCNQLGFPGAVEATGTGSFGFGVGNILLDDLACDGNESFILDCPHNGVGVHNCFISEAAGVVCERAVRLVGTGSDEFRGNVEVYVNGEWGYVCDDSWGQEEADVVCNQFGYTGTALPTIESEFGFGIGTLHLDDLSCFGNETSLLRCQHNGVGNHNCFSSEAAGVICSETVAEEGDVRLVGGTLMTEGNVEIYASGQWGFVCDDLWGVEEATVVCNQLGYEGTAEATLFGEFGSGTGDFQLDDLECTGTEATLLDCPHDGIGIHNCFSFEPAGVRCTDLPPEEGDVRLVGGTTEYEGNVEIFVNETWGFVCDDAWGMQDAQVVCNQLGITGDAEATLIGFFGNGVGTIHLDEVGCGGSEENLLECSHDGIGSHDCFNFEAAGVICTPEVIVNGAVRLSGGDIQSEGNVEIYLDGEWGFVCDNDWGEYDAFVVCWQLGYPDASRATVNSEFGDVASSTSFLLNNVRCLGYEGNLTECNYNRFSTNQDCSVSSAAGVVCSPKTRLVGGTGDFEGNVEVYVDRAWGAVCDDSWGDEEAEVVCRQLGFFGPANATDQGEFGFATGVFQLDDLHCEGTEATLFNCPHNGIGIHNCGTSEAAGVRCTPDIPLRLYGGDHEYEGIVQFYWNGRWGGVCDDFLIDRFEGNVVCRQLGYGPAISSFLFFGPQPDNHNLWLTNLFCFNGDELSINLCDYDIDTACTSFFGDYHLRCSPLAVEKELRLEKGGFRSGRLEISHSGSWGTVCMENFGFEDGTVACRQLGYGDLISFYTDTDITAGPIWLAEVACTGQEADLADCPANEWGQVGNCTHNDDVWIQCGNRNSTVRLVDGDNDYSGILQIFYNGEWGLVCDDFFSYPAGDVACRQLGHQRAYNITSSVDDSGYEYLLDNVRCNGDETNLFQCLHDGWENHNCFNEAVYLECTDEEVYPIRLVDGPNDHSGRIEINRHGEWGTVCDDGWGALEATVACRELGFQEVATELTDEFGPGAESQPIWLDDISCRGDEEAIEDCGSNPISHHDCSHTEDVGIICNDTGKVPIRLVDGSSQYEGRIEVYLNGSWGTICSDYFGFIGFFEGRVVCRHLGWEFVKLQSFRHAPDSTPIHLDSLYCFTGDEETISECDWYINGFCGNDHQYDVGIVCQPEFIEEGAVRLIGGLTENEGNVEVYAEGKWGFVCDDGWDRNDALVVCRQLGYSDVRRITTFGFFGNGIGSVQLDDLECIGNESSLLECPHNGVGIHDCFSFEVAGVECGAFEQKFPLRLADGDHEYEGRVEVYFEGEWGGICDDFLFDSFEGEVICRQLGYGSPISTYSVHFGAQPPDERVWLRNLFCFGDEDFIQDCDYTIDYNDTCSVNDEYHLRCSPTDAEKELRLAGGEFRSGRLEIFHAGAWGSVCSEGFDPVDGRIACQQLGYHDVLQVYIGSEFGEGSGPVWLSNIKCEGNEPDLADCTIGEWGEVGSCTHMNDVGLLCGERNGSIRLVGGDDFSGILEVYYNGQWGLVCDDGFEYASGDVACRQLGHARAVNITSSNFASNNLYLLDEVECRGNESTISECQHDGFGNHNCFGFFGFAFEAVRLYCSDDTIFPIRLADGDNDHSGRVELLRNGIWGTICDDGWGEEEARVVCRELGFFDVATTLARFGNADDSVPIWYDNVRCRGVEEAIEDCAHLGQGAHNCEHFEDVGVVCNDSLVGIRLVDGESQYEGRIEVYVDGKWGTICSAFGFSGFYEGRVVCRHLGWEFVGLQNFRPASNSTPVHIDDLFCTTGEEEQITDCDWFRTGFCGNDHQLDVGIVCRPEAIEEGEIRLIGGALETQGNVEIYLNGEWGYVCDDFWGFEEAQVVCRQLGYTGALQAVLGAYFGFGIGPVHLDDLACTGDEDRLLDCPHPGTGIHNCFFGEAAGVLCRPENVPDVDDYTVRLVGSSSGTNLTGRVQVFYNGAWGTICDDFITVGVADVVCRQLGITDPEQTDLLIRSGFFFFADQPFGPGQDHEPIWLDTLTCTGDEENLNQCNHNGWGFHDCTHTEDIAVTCEAKKPVDVRLVEGTREGEGRVEVNFGGKWGSICDDGFGIEDGEVICRQLGHSGVNNVFGFAAFGSNDDVIWLDNLECLGNETNLAQCEHNGWYNHNCFSFEDAGVSCAVDKIPEDFTIRLSDGVNIHDGRVEVYLDGSWGTVCNDGWDINDANVACDYLHFQGAALATDARTHGIGEGPIHFTHMNCLGEEDDFKGCDYDRDTSNCYHTEDAGLVCNDAENYHVRLVDGTSNTNGRVEVYFSGEWGTVCDWEWDRNDAEVVCRQLGFARAIRPLHSSDVPNGAGRIWLEYVACGGDESNLHECPSRGFGQVSTILCDHSYDAGVECSESAVVPGVLNLQVRLVNTDDPTLNNIDGRLEILYNEQWGTVSIVDFDLLDAEVVCRQLNLFAENIYFSPFDLPADVSFVPVWLDDIECTGDEANIGLCAHPGLGSTYATHSLDVAVKCNSTNVLQDFDIRLVDGTGSHEGRVEVFFGGEWGTVCDDFFTLQDADVICRSLGFDRSTAFYYNAYFGAGTGSILMDNLDCQGHEEELWQCFFLGWNNHNCFHGEDVGVSCYSPHVLPPNLAPLSVRLVGGLLPTEGRVEIFYDETWGTICDSGWSVQDAEVVCNELGYPGVSTPTTGSNFGPGSGPVWLSDTVCSGDEERLVDCHFPGWGSNFLSTGCDTHNRDAGVICETTLGEGAVRLVNGRVEGEGRVEIFHRMEWGSICDIFFDDVDAQVICRQLEYPVEGARAVHNAIFGQATDLRIWLRDIQCHGSEEQITDCMIPPWGEVGGCVHAYDASVICKVDSTEYTNGDLRLVDGDSQAEGRLEIYYRGIWGTVCDDGFDRNDALVACRQLGFADVVSWDDSFGQELPAGPINMHSLRCIGNESYLIDCPFEDDFSLYFCHHAEDVQLHCADVVAPRIASVRLSAGYVSGEGRAEVLAMGQWHTLCNNTINRAAADVFCRQAGFNGVKDIIVIDPLFEVAADTVPIFPDSISCSGNEYSLASCTLTPMSLEGCQHTYDVALRCNRDRVHPLSVSLQHGEFESEGVVFVLNDGTWGGICPGSWTGAEANVVCRQLGYEASYLSTTSEYFHYVSPSNGTVWLSSVSCTGLEERLSDCMYDAPVNTTCTNNLVAGVVCLNASGPSLPNEGDVRLVPGPEYGRVDVYVETLGWGSACGFFWTFENTQVVCRHLGFAAAVEFGSVFFSLLDFGTGPLVDYECEGTESHLNECTIYTGSFCSHFFDVWVRCSETELNTEFTIELRGGNASYGNVYINYEGASGPVCDDFWDIADAHVACRQLGYQNGALQATSFSSFGTGTGFLLDDVECQGGEERLDLCYHGGIGNHNCFSFEVAGVICDTSDYNPPPPPLRLVGGETENEGRIDIYIGNQWGTICSADWGLADAEVACKSLGYTSAQTYDLGHNAPFNGGRFPGGYGLPILITTVGCLGNENNLHQCPYLTGEDITNCDHNNDAGVICRMDDGTGVCTHGDIRLTGSTIERRGYIEVCIHGEWLGVCEDDWNLVTDNPVACKQLGFDHEGIKTSSPSWKRPLTLGIGEFFCDGNEDHLTSCGYSLLESCSGDPVGLNCGTNLMPCPANPEVRFGTISTGTDENHNQFESLTCDVTYEPVGASMRLCDHSNGEWTAEDMSCQPISCVDAPTLENSVEPTYEYPDDQWPALSYYINVSVSYSCLTDYAPKGIEWMVECKLDPTTNTGYWFGADNLPPDGCIYDEAGVAERQRLEQQRVGVAVGVVIPLIIIIVVVVVILIVVLFFVWKRRERKKTEVEDSQPVVYDPDKDRVRDFLEFGNPLYSDSKEDDEFISSI